MCWSTELHSGQAKCPFLNTSDHLLDLSDVPDVLIGDKRLQQSCSSHTSLQTVLSSNYMITQFVVLFSNVEYIDG